MLPFHFILVSNYILTETSDPLTLGFFVFVRKYLVQFWFLALVCVFFLRLFLRFHFISGISTKCYRTQQVLPLRTTLEL